MGEYVDKLEVQVVSRAKYLGLKAKEKAADFFTKENGDVNVVSIVFLIGIAVVLAIVFKDKAKALVESLMGTVSKKATDAIK